MFFAFLFSAIFGAGMPGFSLYFGELINSLGKTTEGNFDAFKT